jgi:aspartyl-tRNA(Asn)/glutamyl-tRNA(Gln) amidotransferase subunit B
MELHAQLLTKSKMFCRDDARIFGAEPNSHVCPVCLGMPGALPVANRLAIEQAIMVGLALNCRIADKAVFARKNYFYPDLPKSYQISMYDQPLCQDGWIEIESTQESERSLARIGVRRVHLEEDTAKSFHAGDCSQVDFNRSGLPLMEIVTEPDIRTPEEARQYLLKLQAILRYLGVSTGDMEKGALRCEPNVSVRRIGTKEFGTKVEVKNLNSFRAVKMALEYEIARQTRVLEAGQQVRQVTMGWAEDRGKTVEQRTKEESDDYRYFPDPDIPPIHISVKWVDELRARLPELADAKRARFLTQYGLPLTEAGVLTADREVAEYFETAVSVGRERGIGPKLISNWVTGELFRLLNAENIEIGELHIVPAQLVDLVALVDQGTITTTSGRAVLEEMFGTGRTAQEIVEQRNLAQISDAVALAQIVKQVVVTNPDQVARYREGKETLLHWFVGQVMKATRGKADPQMVKDLLLEALAE